MVRIIRELAALLSFLLLMSLAGVSRADEIGGPIDPFGIPGFNAVAMVNCFPDNGEPDHLIADIKDLPSNPAVEGMFVTLTLFKGGSSISTTDITPGDNNPSPAVKLRGGRGVYYMIVNKTKPGLRNVEVIFHCQTEDNVHVGTSVTLSHYE